MKKALLNTKAFFIALSLMLLTVGLAKAQTPEKHWHLANHPVTWDVLNMTATVQVSVDGVVLSDSNIEMAAFIGDTLMSEGQFPIIADDGRYLYYMTMNGFLTPAPANFHNRLKFRLYDHATETELDYVAPVEIIYASNRSLGSTAYPFGVQFFTDSEVLEWRKVEGSNLKNGDIVVLAAEESNFIMSRVKGVVGGNYNMTRVDNTITFTEPSTASSWYKKAPQKLIVYKNAVIANTNRVGLFANSGFLRTPEVDPADELEYNDFDLWPALVDENNETEWNTIWAVSTESDVTSVVACGDNPYSTVQYSTSDKQFACFPSADEQGVCFYRLEGPQMFTVNVTVNEEGAGVVSITPEQELYQDGTEINLTATAAIGYEFVNFTVDGTPVETPYVVTSDVEIVANFNHIEYDVTVIADATQGSAVILEDGPYYYGSEITFSATANTGYEFVNWTIGGVEVSTDAAFSYTVIESVEMVAHFEVSTVDQETSFGEGWSWWSTYIEMNGIDGLQLLEDALGDNATQIKSQNRFLLYENNTWDGNLTALNNQQMFRIYTVANGNFTITGFCADPAEHTITLRKGWNWIGYVESTVMDPNVAMANLTAAVENDCLKSYTDFATYYEGYGWYGDLEVLVPGEGYMLRMTNAGSFKYASSSKSTVVNSTHSNVNKYWRPVVGKFPDNMNVLAVVELNGKELRSEEAELAAFDVNGECRGSALLRYVEPIDRYVAFLTVYGENDDVLSLRLRHEGITYNLNEQLTMMADEIIGKGTEPYKMTVKGTGLNEINANLNLYPNPVGLGQEVRIEWPENLGNATVEVIDVMGRTISRNVVDSGDGACTVSTPDVPDVYTLRVTNEQGAAFFGKMIVK